MELAWFNAHPVLVETPNNGNYYVSVEYFSGGRIRFATDAEITKLVQQRGAGHWPFGWMRADGRWPGFANSAPRELVVPVDQRNNGLPWETKPVTIYQPTDDKDLPLFSLAGSADGGVRDLTAAWWREDYWRDR